MFDVSNSRSIDIMQFESLSNGIDQQNAAQALHEDLKTLKAGKTTVSVHEDAVQVGLITCPIGERLHTLKVSWNEKEQRFGVQEMNLRAAMSGSDSAASGDSLSPIAVNISRKLTEIAQRDREARRADKYSLHEQDQQGIHQELLAPAINLNNQVITVAHENRQEALIAPAPQSHQTENAKAASIEVTVSHMSFNEGAPFSNREVAPSSIQFGSMPRVPITDHEDNLAQVSQPGIVHVSDLKAASLSKPSSSSIKDRAVLLYGFEGPRAELIKNLKNKFGLTKIQTINTYNENIGIDGRNGKFGFEEYCQFLHDAVTENLSNRLASSAGANCTEAEMLAWAKCLTQNVSKFDFAQKLNSPEKRMQFFIKNCDVSKVLKIFNKFSNKNQNISTTNIREAFSNRNWDTVVTLLQPAFDLLENAANTSSRSQLEDQYKTLKKEQRQVLDVMVSRAFLRKTSKLGLTFAQEQGQPILFAWSASGTRNDLNALHELLEVKPYKAEPPEFRINPEKKGIAQNSPEGITFSEMRELGRLKQKMMAPSYLLITDMKEATAPLQS